MDEEEGDLLEIPDKSIILNDRNVSHDLIDKLKPEIKNRNNWHAFLIHGVRNQNRNEILKIVLNYVYPEALLPIYFKSSGSDCSFLARNCSGAILKLLHNKLIIPDSTDTSRTYNCEIIVKYSTVASLPLPASNISFLLKQLYEDNSKTLNLEKFSENKGLTDYNPLSQPKLLCFALRMSDKMKPACIKLNDNEIKTLSPFEVLHGSSSVKKLDLRNNLIEDIEELEHLKVFDLAELWLTGNPVCKKYDAFSYVQSIRQIIPMLKILDGVPLGLGRLPMHQRNFLCNNEGFDLVDQFNNHFFSLYDSKREILKNLYHPSAIFSITTESSQINKAYDRLYIYRELCRNFSNSSCDRATIGNNEIIKIFQKLPQTKHNRPTFSVDLFFYSERSATLSVIGTFYEVTKPTFEPDVNFGFKRTFALIKHDSEYVICNEFLHVYQVKETQTSTQQNSQVQQLYNISEKNKDLVEEAMSRLVGLNGSWLKRLLEEANYNIIEFVRTFMVLLKRDQIPKQAYSRNNQSGSLVEWLIPKMIEFGMETFEYTLREQVLQYLVSHPSILENINILSTNWSATHQQYCMQKLETSMNDSHSIYLDTGVPNQYTYGTKVSEYSFQSSEVLQYQLSHPKKNRKNKRTIADLEIKTEIQNKKSKIAFISTSEHNVHESMKVIDINPISKQQVHTHARSNLIVIAMQIENQTKHDLLINPIPLSTPAVCSFEEGGKTSADNHNKKSSYTNAEIIPENKTKVDTDFPPKLALLDGKWTNIEDSDEYDFQLAFDKWILVLKSTEDKRFSKQDDFQKNFTCWKKHFPTYDEEMNHSLHSSCINPHFESFFETIKFPVTFWDFPATVPVDIRPPKSEFLSDIEKLITPNCGYGFIFMEKKWNLVLRNDLNHWVLASNKKNVSRMNNTWVIEPMMIQTEITNNNELEENELILYDGEEQEIDGEYVNLFEEAEGEEIESIYTADIEQERTITNSSYAFYLDQNSKENEFNIAPPRSVKSDEANMLIKWNKIFEFVPYIPKVVLMNGNWIVVSEEANLKFYRTRQNKWVLLEKKYEENTWQVINDDFSIDPETLSHTEKVQLFKRLDKHIFDRLPIPVTMYDFSRSVPERLLPPGKVVVDNEIIHVIPNSNYAYVSINGQWVAVKKKGNIWEAVHKVNKSILKQKLTTLTCKLTENKVSVEMLSEDEQKRSSATCTILHIVMGTKLVKPLTHSDIEGQEVNKPPRLALTDINGEQLWCNVTSGSGKGFVLVDGVWVKVIHSFGEWKATTFSAYPGCIVGYCLYGNIWITMKRHILGGKWTPIFNMKITPTTYWNYVGDEELKPPRKIFVAGAEKIIHNNSNMGFMKNKDVWVLMERKGEDWKIAKENESFIIYKLIYGTWTRMETNKWYNRPVEQKLSTYQNFCGLKKYAPPKEVIASKDGKEMKKIIDGDSGLGFILKNGVWVLMQTKNGNIEPVKNSKGQINFGYIRIDEKFKIIHMNANGEWNHSEKMIQNEVKSHYESPSLNPKFSDPIPLTYDRILMDLADNMKPPKFALIKDPIKNEVYWHLVDENSGYGFVKENDTWLLMKWKDSSWVNSVDEDGVEYRYKIVNNTWVPMKKEHNKWLPIFDPYKTPKVPDLCLDSPEKDLPNKIEIYTDNSRTKINITPSCGMGYMKCFDEYILMRTTLNGKWVIYEQSNDALIFRMNGMCRWTRYTRNLDLLNVEYLTVSSNKINDNEVVSTYSNTQGSDSTKPPRYIKIMEDGVMKWKEININDGFGFVNRNYWFLVQKIEDHWLVVNNNESYKIIDNRWLPMKKIKGNWSPAFNPFRTPRCSLDNTSNIIFPIRVITYKNGHPKYINTANDCSLAFMIENPHIFILMKKQQGNWEMMKDDFVEAPTLAFKLLKSKWHRVKKNLETHKWIPCEKQFDLPVLHIDIVNKLYSQPPSEISITDADNREHKMCFNIFSNEGFVKQQDVWLLKKPTDNGWSNYPGIFGYYGYKMVNGEVIVMEEKNGKWEPYNNASIPVLQPITYRETENWPEIERPPMIFYLPHKSLLVNANDDCQFGFVKHKDVWLVVKEKKAIWSFEKNCKKFLAYKLLNKRWVTMEINILNDWIPSFNPSQTPYTHLNTAGEFQDRPPLRIVLNDDLEWTTICNTARFGFSKGGKDMWVVMTKMHEKWVEYDNDNKQLGYKIIDGQWRRFTRPANGEWNICTKEIPPVLSCDFTPKNRNAPPVSLDFFTSYISRSINIGINSGKGFIEDNGAWVLMQTENKKWKRVDRFPFQKDLYAFKLINDVWNLVKKDYDGSWKSGFIDNQGQWTYDELPIIPLRKRLPGELFGGGPPKILILYFGALPKLVFLKSMEGIFGFDYYKGAWILLEFDKNKHWKIAGGIIAYKLIKSRWVTVKIQDGRWIPLYDPVTTPITHFESSSSLPDSKPPLRIVLNESGKDCWKVIFQNSGYGFIECDDMWLLMKKRCDETWEKHEDYLSEYTAYKIIDGKWTRLKKQKYGQWMRKDSSLPLLQCDFSESHSQKPPPSFDKTFLIKPQNTQECINISLDLLSKFGFREENDVWILMNCDSVGSWSEHKLNPNEQELFGYKFSDGGWKLLKKKEEGQWISGRLQHLIGDKWKFIEEKIKQPKQDALDKNACQSKQENENVIENRTQCKSKRGNDMKGLIVKCKNEIVRTENRRLEDFRNIEPENERVSVNVDIKNERKCQNEKKIGNVKGENVPDDTIQEEQDYDANHQSLQVGVGTYSRLDCDLIEDDTAGGKKYSIIEQKKDTSGFSNKKENHSQRAFKIIGRSRNGTTNEENAKGKIEKEGEHDAAIKDLNHETTEDEKKQLCNHQHKELGKSDNQRENNVEHSAIFMNDSQNDSNENIKEVFEGNLEMKNNDQKTLEYETRGEKGEISIVQSDKICDNYDKEENTYTIRSEREMNGNELKINCGNSQGVIKKKSKQQEYDNGNLQEIKNHNQNRENSDSVFTRKVYDARSNVKVDDRIRRASNDLNAEGKIFDEGQNVIYENSIGRGAIEDENKKEIILKEETNFGESFHVKKSLEIAIIHPVKYQECTGLPISERPPKHVCLKIRGSHRRISLTSKKSKIGFQLHNGAWILLECLSDTWKILHNSAGFPLAYKLIDNRWVSMRLNSENGSWIPAYNPKTTPRTYFDTEGPEESRPPRRVILQENGLLIWKEISEYSGFGFIKNEDMWLLMRNSSKNNWIEYRNQKDEVCAYKIQNDKWTKFTLNTAGSWQTSTDDLPVLNYDFVGGSEAAPPDYTVYLQKLTGQGTKDFGFHWVNGAWILMQRKEKDRWARISDGTNIYGFMRGTGELWDIVKKDADGNWIRVERYHNIQSAFEDFFKKGVKRVGTTDKCCNGGNKICFASSCAFEENNLTDFHKNKKNCIRKTATIKSNDPDVSTQTDDITVKSATERDGGNEDKREAPLISDQNILLPRFSDNNIQMSTKIAEDYESVEVAQEQVDVYQLKFNTATPSSSEKSLNPIQEPFITSTESEETGSLELLNQKSQKDCNGLQQENVLNSVEMYLAGKPDCCSGCPELQNLLRQFRPSDIPNKIIRKKFKLPDGSTRLLSIPKAVTES